MSDVIIMCERYDSPSRAVWTGFANGVGVGFTTCDLTLRLSCRGIGGPGWVGAELVDDHGNVHAVRREATTLGTPTVMGALP